MDHTLEELSDCIFDYLSSEPETTKSLHQIYNSITGETGHRCSELNKAAHREINKRKFMVDCYTIDAKFENIKKTFKNGKLYLTYSDTDIVPIIKSETHFMEDEDIVVALNMLEDINNINIDCKFENDDTLLHVLVQYNYSDDLKKLLDRYNFNMNQKNKFGMTALDIARNNKKTESLYVLLTHKYERMILDLKHINKELVNANTNKQRKINYMINKNWCKDMGIAIISIIIGMGILWYSTL